MAFDRGSTRISTSHPSRSVRSSWVRRAPFLVAACLVLAMVAPAFAQGGAATASGGGTTIGILLPPKDQGSGLERAVASSAWLGTAMATDELGTNAQMLGIPFGAETAAAATPEEAAAAAQRLIDAGAIALVADVYGDALRAVVPVAARNRVPLVNALDPSHDLRAAACSPFLFDVAPSDAMAIDALLGWFVRSGFRSWAFVTTDDAQGAALLARSEAAMRGRHFGAREVAKVRVQVGHAGDAKAARAAADAHPDVVLLLLSARDQLDFLTAFEATGAEAEVTGLPHAETQTRAFLAASLAAAPSAGAGYRAETWDAELDAYGARELNARFRQRFGEPMDGISWGAYQAVKVLYESVTTGGADTPGAIRDHLEDPSTVFDVWKGIGTSFRPWNHQLRQSLFLVHLKPDGDGGAAVTLVGELPAIYMPGTDPLERLDQLGDTKKGTTCRF